ncbi:unnamed protein product [Oppiella nova]|uniref:Major facilitator superfamily (MFS) profile domain-containing protein n=1 Tax=Oppiella nova TaxID=334625 RepID=A0A7R9QAL4_9ACAR|nr:unnamed protein product [Oppiella nova]CAG2161783.1 unnamed protein product [Oppiella nova]
MRYVVAGLVLFATLNLYMCRINLSIAIVAMSRFNKTSHSSGSDVCDTNAYTTDPNNSTNSTTAYQSPHTEPTGEFDWDEKTQGMILGTFFYGYILFQVVGGRLSEMFGAKWLCGGGIAVSIVVNALTPIIARSGQYWLLLASRVVLGVFQSFVFPSIYALFSKWAPDSERSTCLAIPYVGANIGSVATTALSGYLSEHGFAGGWPSVFYVSAILATVWLVLWVILVRSEPKDHPWIAREELHYIQANIASSGKGSTKPPVPWMKIFTSIPVIAVVVVKFTVNWNCILLLLKLPSYFSSVFKYPVSKGMFLFGCYSGGDVPVVADMTNKYSATVFGITNTVAFTAGFITPMVIGLIVQASDEVRRQWGYVFWMSAAINAFGGLVFIVFGSAQQQEWDKHTTQPEPGVVSNM